MDAPPVNDYSAATVEAAARKIQTTNDGTVDRRGAPANKLKTGGWRACPFILATECCERLAYYGIATNMVMYMRNKLGQNNASAATNVNNWSGTCYITPLIGGFIADAYIGRFWTIAVFSAVYFFGMTLLTLSSSLPSLRPECHGNSCSKATLGQLSAFYVALYLIALGTGGIKPCVSSFGADQFDSTDTVENKRKASFFNWFYFSINIGALISSTILVYIQDQVSWSWGFGIPTVAMGIAICTFFIGTPLYRFQKPGGSPLTRIVQVLVAACRKWRIPLPENDKELYEVEDKESAIQGSSKIQHTNEFRFLDKAAVAEEELPKARDQAPSPWRLCTVTQVEEMKILLRILPIWATTIVFSTVYNQMSTLFVEQGGMMNTYIGGSNFHIPPASLSVFDTLSVIVLVPVYDRLLLPLLRRKPGGFTYLQRIGTGLFISIFAMVVAAVVEIERLRSVRSKGLVDADIDQKNVERMMMSIFWQVPQYFLIGAAEVFTFIGQIEFFYDQAPDAMRSLLSALSLTTTALGSYLSSLLVTIVTRVTKKGNSPGWIADNLNRGHMDYFFWLLAVLSFINLGLFILCARRFKYKEVNEDDEK